MIKEIIGQILGICVAITTFISYQTNTKKALLTVQTVATLLTCFSYLFLGASSGFALNGLCVVRNIVFYFQEDKTFAKHLSSAIFAVAIVILGAFSWQGPVSLLIIVALAVNSVFLSFGNPQLLRKSLLFTCPVVLIYNIFVFSIGGILNESIATVSAIIGIIRFRKNKNEQKEQSSVNSNRR